jgi:hypothetical protein
MSITLKKQDGDLEHLSSNGGMYYIQGIEKLTQEVADVLMTIYDPERGWGSQLNTLIGNVSKPGVIIDVIGQSLIQQAVDDAVDRLKQRQKETYLLTDIETVDTSTVQVFTVDKTMYTFYLQVKPVSGPDQIPSAFSVHLRQQIPDLNNIPLT